MADRLCDGILAGRYSPGGRIPSVRELSEMMEVNTNTVVRAYDLLTRQGDRRRQFMEEKLPEMFRQMRMLDIPIDTVDRMWEELTR